MNRLIVIVEGQTEKQFIKTIISPYFGEINIFITARLIGKPGHKGGVGNWQRAKSEICAILKQDKNIYCTTMFDYYGMPLSWPGRKQALKSRLHSPFFIETAIDKDIQYEMGTSFEHDRFFSYVQMFEFEALLFSDPKKLADTLEPKKSNHLIDSFEKIVSLYKTPEQINNNPDTSPSQLIMKFYPGYQKVFHSVIAAQRIGIELMKQKCLHFREWIEKLESFKHKALTADL